MQPVCVAAASSKPQSHETRMSAGGRKSANQIGQRQTSKPRFVGLAVNREPHDTAQSIGAGQLVSLLSIAAKAVAITHSARFTLARPLGMLAEVIPAGFEGSDGSDRFDGFIGRQDRKPPIVRRLGANR